MERKVEEEVDELKRKVEDGWVKWKGKMEDSQKCRKKWRRGRQKQWSEKWRRVRLKKSGGEGK